MNFQVPWNKELFLKQLSDSQLPTEAPTPLSALLACSILAVEGNAEGTGNGLSMTQVAYH